MLREFKDVKQEPGPGKRRWWGGDGFEFTVWYDEGEVFSGFQLCYRDFAFTWHTTGYWSHVKVGESFEGGRVAGYGVPILQANGAPPNPSPRLADKFQRASVNTVGDSIREMVTTILSICAR